MCWLPEGLDLLWAVDHNKALNFLVYLLCRGDPWSPVESTLAPVRAASLAFNRDRSDWQSGPWQTVRLSFGKAGEIYPSVQSLWCYQELLSLLCSAEHRHTCSLRRGIPKLHTLSACFCKNTRASITNLGSLPIIAFSDLNNEKLLCWQSLSNYTSLICWAIYI